MITGNQTTLTRSDRKLIYAVIVIVILLGLLVWAFAVMNQQKDIIDKQKQKIEELQNDTTPKSKILLIIPEPRD